MKTFADDELTDIRGKQGLTIWFGIDLVFNYCSRRTTCPHLRQADVGITRKGSPKGLENNPGFVIFHQPQVSLRRTPYKMSERWFRGVHSRKLSVTASYSMANRGHSRSDSFSSKGGECDWGQVGAESKTDCRKRDSNFSQDCWVASASKCCGLVRALHIPADLTI